MNSFDGALDAETERVGTLVVDSIYSVHKKAGPGLLEAFYERCLEYELSKRGLSVGRQLLLPARYDELLIEGAFRVDILVNELVLIEVKAVEQIHEVFKAQLLTYMRLTGIHLGFLVNFNVPVIKDGLKRFVK